MTPKQVAQARLDQKLDKLLEVIKDANHFLGLANERVSITQDLPDARSELANVQCD